jgi:hypothetical protein
LFVGKGDTVLHTGEIGSIAGAFVRTCVTATGLIKGQRVRALYNDTPGAEPRARVAETTASG